MTNRKLLFASIAIAAVLLIAGATVAITLLLMSGNTKTVVLTTPEPAPLNTNPTIGSATPPAVPRDVPNRPAPAGLNGGRAADALPLTIRPAAPRTAPFSGLRWVDDKPQVQVQQTWYDLLAVDGLPIDQIIQSAQASYPGDYKGQPAWKTRFGEDFVDVMTKMPHPLNNIVSLDLRKLDTGETVNIPKVAMTEANRSAILTASNTRAARGGAAQGVIGGTIGTGAPFTAVRFLDDTPLVKVNGTWYEFLAVDDVPLDQIRTSAKQKYPDSTMTGWWKRQFLQVFGTVVATTGHKVGNTVKLSLQTLDTNQPVTLADVPMVPQNQIMAMQFMRSSPFTATRMGAGKPQVRVNDTWYEFASMDGHSLAPELVVSAGSPLFTSRETWMYNGWTPGETVKLELLSLPNHDPVTLSDVPVTPMNLELTELYGLRSPFTGLRWHDTTPEVQVTGVWYELVSMDGHPASEIGKSTDRKLDAPANALAGMGDQLFDTVQLQLRALDTNQPVSMADVPMSTANHQVAEGWVQTPGNADPSGLQNGPILGKVRWNGETPQVQLSDTWYELLAIDDNPVADIIAFAKNQYGADWQRNQFEDRTEKVMNQFGHNLWMPPNYFVTLQLKTLDTGEVVKIIRTKPNFARIPAPK